MPFNEESRRNYNKLMVGKVGLPFFVFNSCKAVALHKVSQFSRSGRLHSGIRFRIEAYVCLAILVLDLQVFQPDPLRRTT